MILTIHTMAGVVLSSNSQNIGEAIILCFVSHYFLDSIPHFEYEIGQIKNGQIKSAIKNFTKVGVDLFISMLVIFLFLWNKGFEQTNLILIGVFFALLPDGLVLLSYYAKSINKIHKSMNSIFKFLKIHEIFHEKMHFKSAPKYIIMICQITVVIVLIMSLLFFP
jgi:hypothetical protein